MFYLLGTLIGALIITKILIMIVKTALPDKEPSWPFLIGGGIPVFVTTFASLSPPEVACYPIAAGIWFLIDRKRNSISK